MAVLEGLVHDVDMRYEQIPWQRMVLSFRIDARGPDGGVQQKQVEMRGSWWKGTVRNGDRVRLEGNWRGGRFVARRGVNLATESGIGPRIGTRFVLFSGLASLLLFAGVVAAAVLVIASHGDDSAAAGPSGDGVVTDGGVQPALSQVIAGSRPCPSSPTIYRNANTSCGFAQNVVDAWSDASEHNPSGQFLNAYSPVTGRTYSVRCFPVFRYVECVNVARGIALVFNERT